MEMEISSGCDESSQDTLNEDSDNGNTFDDETRVEIDVFGEDICASSASESFDDLVALVRNRNAVQNGISEVVSRLARNEQNLVEE